MLQTRKIFIASLIMFLTLTQVAVGAEVIWSAKPQTIGVGDSVLVDLFLATGRQTINAVEGTVVVPAGLEVVDIRVGGSLVNLWIEAPKETTLGSGKIKFSGITPGGYRGEQMSLFSLVLKAKSAGQMKVYLEDFRALVNDGLGSEIPVELSVISIDVKSQAVGTVVEDIIDESKPGTFDIQVGKDEAIFNGQWLAIFLASDKGIGVDSYEIKESKSRILSIFSQWRKTDSPALLTDQKLNSFIWVKAIDKNNNSQIVLAKPSNPLSLYLNYDFWIIIILISIISLVVYKKWILNRRR